MREVMMKYRASGFYFLTVLYSQHIVILIPINQPTLRSSRDRSGGCNDRGDLSGLHAGSSRGSRASAEIGNQRRFGDQWGGDRGNSGRGSTADCRLGSGKKTTNRLHGMIDG